MNDRELRKWIQDQSENIEIPASLEPENVVKQLEEKAKKKKTAYYRKVIGTAACLAVVAGIGAAGIAGVFGSRGNEGAGIQQAAEQEDETEFGKVAAITTADMDVKRVDSAYYREYTVAETFDISNPEEPKSVGKVSQSGSFHTMRAVGDYVYLFSNYYPEMDSSRTYVDGYIPKVQGEALCRLHGLEVSQKWKTRAKRIVIRYTFWMKI